MHRKNTQKGFSLVETLVAISILLLAVVGPMSIATQSIKTATFNRQQTVAVFIAQEALEALIKSRNEAALSGGATWDWYDDGSGTDLESICAGPDGCGYSAHDGSFTACTSLNDCLLQFDESASDGWLYSHDTGEGAPSKFTRRIFTDDSGNVSNPGDEIEVSIEVSWATGVFSVGQTYTLTSSIFDVYGP